MGKKLTKEDFINRAKEIHDGKYDYSKTEYKNFTTKVIITCDIHGEFLQTPDKHLSAQGCPECGGGLKLNNVEFKKRGIKIHNNKYDYSNVQYKDMHSKVYIICPIHGEFLQKPNNHLNQKQGCPNCIFNPKLETKSFIEKAKKIHGNKYSYKKSLFEKHNKEIIIICKTHSEFAQKPVKHLQGQGCPKCVGMYMTTNEFIEKVKVVHNNLYDYSLVNYVDSKTKVKIICKKHGVFEQLSGNHLFGRGCPGCNKSKGEIKVETILKENNIEYKPQYTFDNLKFKKKLRFDFGIIDDNRLLFLIEFNGSQHYIRNKKIQSEKVFEQQQIKDNLKKEYCIKNNIPLYIIKYNEDISEKMNEILNGTK